MKEKTCATGATCECRKLPVGPGNAPWKNLKSGPLRVHFQHSGTQIRVFEQNTDIIKFWLFLG